MVLDLNTLIPHMIAAVVGGAGVYAAIKADLARAIVQAENAIASAAKAHERIDKLMEGMN